MKTSSTPSPNRFLLLLGLIFTLAFTMTATASAGRKAEAEALTHSLVGLNNAYQKARTDAKSAALQKLIDATVERQALLAELIESDPGAVLRVAMPERVRQQMPQEVQAFIERRLELEGELEVMYEDYADGSHRLLHGLHADGRRVSLHFDKSPSGLLTGRQAHVRGVLVGESMAVDSGKEDILILALDGGEEGGTNGGSPAPVPNTFGEQRTLVILVNFQDDPVEPYTPEFARDVIFGETSEFFLENSFGQTWIGGDVIGWHTIPVLSTECDSIGIRDYAEQAALSAGFDPAAYARLVYAFPTNACGFWGSATVGGSPSRAWFKGDLELEMTGHELGHNLGLEHSHSLVCSDGTSVGPGSAVTGSYPWPNCSRLEYGDGLDIMGHSLSGHFTAFQKERLGWLRHDTTPGIEVVEASGTYELAPYAAQTGTAPRSLKLFKAEDQYGLKTWYFLEYRQAIGFDSILTNYYSTMDAGNVLNGIAVHAYWEGGGGYGGYLLDMTTDTNAELYTSDPALVAGETFVDPDGMTTITTEFTDPAGAMVRISVETPVCTPANPIVELTPSESQWVAPGTPVIYTASLKNRDSSACAPATFDLSADVPAGWSQSLADTVLILEPGASAITTMAVTSTSTAVDGFYDVSLSAANSADSAYSTSAMATYVVYVPVANEPPNALNDIAETDQETSVQINVLTNDSDPDGDLLTVVSATQGSHGIVTVVAGGYLSYTPADGYSGTDNFAYTISDGNGGSDSATVTMTVHAAGSNAAPVALHDAVTITEEAPVTIDVMANDRDADGDALTVVAVTQGAKGEVKINVDNTVTYSPAKRFKDGDSFSYSISDGDMSATATVTVTLQSSGGDDSGTGGKGGGRKPK
jgi:hypothetical protein